MHVRFVSAAAVVLCFLVVVALCIANIRSTLAAVTANPCNYCKYCNYCTMCATQCPCNPGDNRFGCKYCQYCPYCKYCSKACGPDSLICGNNGVVGKAVNFWNSVKDVTSGWLSALGVNVASAGIDERDADQILNTAKDLDIDAIDAELSAHKSRQSPIPIPKVPTTKPREKEQKHDEL